MNFRSPFLIGLMLTVVSGVARAETSGPLEAQLQRWDGTSARISAYRGKPTVVFYEDRGSREVNRRLKNELLERGQRRGLMNAANVVAVANLNAYDFFPARQFAKKAIRDVENQVKIPVLIDWKCALTTSPWNLPPKNSTILLLDASGRAVFERTGTLSAEEIEDLFQRLDNLLGIRPEEHGLKAQR